MIVTVLLVLAAAILLWLAYAFATAPEGVEIEGVGFVEKENSATPVGGHIGDAPNAGAQL